MSYALGIVMDPLEGLTPKKDTTVALMLEAQRRGYAVYTMSPDALYLDGEVVRASMYQTVLKDQDSDYFVREAPVDRALSDLDLVLMRLDPPFNMHYIYCTYLLERAQKAGVCVLNDPRSLRDANEKLFACEFPQCAPPSMVSAQSSVLKRFIERHEDVIIKPLDGMGGRSIFRVRLGDPNTEVILSVMTSDGVVPVMAQRFIPEIASGDKRILLIDGVPVPYALARVPHKPDARGNLAAGAIAKGQALSDRDQWICEQVGPVLKEKGLFFVGIDVIGDYLTEINVTSPTGLRELDRCFNLNIAGDFFDALALRVGND